MNLEINKPELLHRVNAHIKAGHFHNADEVLEKALDALEEKTSVPTSAASDKSGAALLAVLQNSPYPEIDLAPPRERGPVQVRDVVL